MDNRLDAIDKRFDAIDNRLDSMDKRLDQQEGLLTQLIGVVKSTNEKVTVLQQDMEEIKGTVSGMKVAIDEQRTVNHRQDRIMESLAMRSLEQETRLRELQRSEAV
ncbi:hypothetical protein EHV15_04635 [Paenibacillus oralis]|uniref:t-SNARE coiled-coil homology domain-containing protein n=1 Tax=Paenibacillus oralis TaxID=2490856 RepID=A0A3P3UCX8_9BACL|nr:hypothetical protein EHV15_04635 [Paenibacillus oralis]